MKDANHRNFGGSKVGAIESSSDREGKREEEGKLSNATMLAPELGRAPVELLLLNICSTMLLCTNASPLRALSTVAKDKCLATLAPDVAAQWHPTKNGDVTPADVTSRSGHKYWWQCDVNPAHEWQATPANRVSSGTGCPHRCAVRVPIAKSLAIIAPDVAAQWHPTKNGDVTPADIYSKTKENYWWKCDAGPDHEWQARPDHRVGRAGKGTGCPYCSGRNVSVTNSLATLAPEVAAQWHPTKNGDIMPADVVSQTAKKYWWVCVVGPDHVWEATPNDRVGKGSGCPFCSGRKVSVANSLATLAPEVAAQWHPTKNGDLTPADVPSRTNKKHWWRCDTNPNHEWEATSNERIGSERGCPHCSRRKVSVTNSLATHAPDVAAQCHKADKGIRGRRWWTLWLWLSRIYRAITERRA
jgi:hypothetical protein